MIRFAHCVVVVLLILEATLATASAQGRGHGGSAGAPGTMVRGGAAPSNARGGAPPAQRGGVPPVARPPIATPRPPVNRPSYGPSGSHFVVRPQRQVFIGSPYPSIYYPYGYSSVYSPFPYLSYQEPYDDPLSQSYVQTDLANQVERLTQEVEKLRQDQANLVLQLSQAPPPRQAPEAPAAPLTLVFRDGRRLYIQNYAIVRGSLWALDENMSTRILLSDLDLDATRRANPGRNLALPVEPAR